MGTLKKNVDVFNADVANNQGYRYSTNAQLSSVVANQRITDATLALIGKDVKTVMDIGAGDGTYTNAISEARPDIEITGFDPAADAVALAGKKYPNIEFVAGNLLEAATIPHRKCDVGVIRGVLHHLNDPKLAIQNSGLMADRLIIIEPNGNNPVLKVIEKVSPYHVLHEERSFSSRLLRRWCEESGYVVESLDYIGFVPMFFPTIPTKIIHFFQPLGEMIFPLKKYLGAQIVISCRKRDN